MVGLDNRAPILAQAKRACQPVELEGRASHYLPRGKSLRPTVEWRFRWGGEHGGSVTNSLMRRGSQVRVVSYVHRLFHDMLQMLLRARVILFHVSHLCVVHRLMQILSSEVVSGSFALLVVDERENYFGEGKSPAGVTELQLNHGVRVVR